MYEGGNTVSGALEPLVSSIIFRIGSLMSHPAGQKYACLDFRYSTDAYLWGKDFLAPSRVYSKIFLAVAKANI